MLFLTDEDGQTRLAEVDTKRWPDFGLTLGNSTKVIVHLVECSAFDSVVTDKAMTSLQIKAHFPVLARE